MQQRRRLRGNRAGNTQCQQRRIGEHHLRVGARQTINEALTHAAQAHDRGKIRIGQDDIGDLLGDVASATHGQAHVGQAQRR